MKLVLSPKFLAIGFMLICASQVIFSMEDVFVTLAPGEEYDGITWISPPGGKGGTLSNPRGQKIEIQPVKNHIPPLKTTETQQYIPRNFIHPKDRGIFFRIETTGDQQ
ncbi:uncharacterized protein MELLADRAFT_123530 [Melampsora larici-populina 98AG31]|uniref:Secreted protein n=1 Tax=Melampsora larici-populina (strain 98AG31 / pathotype 3-4-7) TaxID=747676 RepID=F4R5S1_MELLP|nr:uncharacterized protein MELLADRAFT_123530 [Melampsora larici-populina 98AG31]EGG12208.1 secreted protein [Melampsora larici-populina 98AG31]